MVLTANFRSLAMSHLVLNAKSKLLAGLAIVAVGALSHITPVQAATVVIPYAGSFNEAAIGAEDGLPAGDYDTIGGMADVGTSLRVSTVSQVQCGRQAIALIFS
jgi:hypothetical protein